MDDSEGPRKENSNGAGPGRNVQGGGAVGINLWKKELGGDRGDAQGPDGVPPLGGAKDHRDDGKTWGRRRVGLSRGREGDRLCEASPHRSLNQESAHKNSGEGGLSNCL